MKALIAEDESVARKLMQVMLKEHFDTVDIAEDGAEAVVLVWEQLRAEQPYDLICLDIMMPSRDGRQALQLIRDMEKVLQVEVKDQSKIIMATALEDSETVLASFRNECDGYLVKPIDATDLTEKLNELGFKK